MTTIKIRIKADADGGVDFHVIGHGKRSNKVEIAISQQIIEAVKKWINDHGEGFHELPSTQYVFKQPSSTSAN